MDHTGSSPAWSHKHVPITLQEAKPRAGTIAATAIGRACAPHAAKRIAYGRSPEANIESPQARRPVLFLLPLTDGEPGQPDENQSGRAMR
jgi:hypothetical protein